MRLGVKGLTTEILKFKSLHTKLSYLVLVPVAWNQSFIRDVSMGSD